MAMCIRFVCPGCGFAVESWEDGNPFYIGGSGQKVYAYHPDRDELAKCIANDVPHLCLDCGVESTVDSRQSSKTCPLCGSHNTICTDDLEVVNCPKCKEGHFGIDKDFRCIS